MSDDELLLRKKVERQQRQIELLEQMIEDRARDIFQVNEELQKTNDRLQTSLDELQSTQRALVDASRKAGMADVATTVLHNVGNALNSVNVAANMLSSVAKGSKAAGVGKAVAMLRAQPDPGKFLTEDPRGKKLLDYLAGVGTALEGDQAKSLEELGVLEKSVEHIKAIVMTQQTHARGGHAIERIAIKATIEDVIRLGGASAAAASVHTTCSFEGLEDGDSMKVDRHKLFQILMNLLTNAVQALKPRSSDKRLDLRVERTHDDRIRISVTDNGVGIPAENLTKIFAHGFTTKSAGHGFGLHSCANAAVEMGGKLEALSEGPGFGATFVLSLPRNAVTSLQEAA